MRFPFCLLNRNDLHTHPQSSGGSKSLYGVQCRCRHFPHESAKLSCGDSPEAPAPKPRPVCGFCRSLRRFCSRDLYRVASPDATRTHPVSHRGTTLRRRRSYEFRPVQRTRLRPLLAPPAPRTAHHRSVGQATSLRTLCGLSRRTRDTTSKCRRSLACSLSSVTFIRA